jgi:hypothetical protein
MAAVLISSLLVLRLPEDFSKKVLSEKYRYLPVSAHKEALQVKLPGGLTATGSFLL